MIFDEENAKELEAHWCFNFVKKKNAIRMINQGSMFIKCVAIFPNTESSNNKYGLIGTVNSKNWLYPVLFGR